MNNSSLNLFLVTLLLINKTFANDVQSSNEIHRQFTPRLMASKVLKDYNVDDLTDNKAFVPINDNNVMNNDEENAVSYENANSESREENLNYPPNDAGDIQMKYKILLKLLDDKTGMMPLIYLNDDDVEQTANGNKRSGRYYQRYPWKRQNTRYRTSRTQPHYEADMRYLCVPSKEEVFDLIAGLHESRNGIDRTVNFCNRKRKAQAIFTNIRFLG